MRKAFAVALLLLMATSHAWADSLEIAPPPENWNKVQSLPPNANITIELKHGGKISGTFIRLTEDSILLTEYAREQTYPKNAIAQIKRMRPASPFRNAAIVGSVCFGIGFGLGYAAAAHAADQDHTSVGERAKVGAAIGGVFGGAMAATSLVLPAGVRNEVIYRARQQNQ